jgi:hypothetical protein
MGRIDFIINGPMEAEKKAAPASDAKKAIVDLKSRVSQSSQWDKNWGGSEASALDSHTGFYNSPAEKGKEFWINTQFPDYNVYEVTEIILKKIEHKCCHKSTMDGLIVTYYYKNEWHEYNGGAVIKTGQMPDDDVSKERVITLNPPIKASMVKLTNPRKERSTNDAQGRFDLMIRGPVEKPSERPTVDGAQRAILDLGSETKQSSSWGADWGGA